MQKTIKREIKTMFKENTFRKCFFFKGKEYELLRRVDRWKTGTIIGFELNDADIFIIADALIEKREPTKQDWQELITKFKEKIGGLNA